jgi:hypothetical protein
MGCWRPYLLAGAAGITWGAGIGWGATIPSGNVEQIVQHSEQTIAADWSHAPEYSYIERDVESKHDSRRTVKTYQVLMIDGSPYNRLIAVDDKPLPPAQKAEEMRKLQLEIQQRQQESERARQKRIGKYLRERHQDSALLKGMMSAFDFRLVGEATVDGHECWVLDAIPKAGYEPTSRETKVLKGMRGRMWVDEASGQWVKVTAEVVQPVSLFGFFAKVRPGTRFMLEQEPVTAHLWLPKHFTTQVSASALGFLNEDSVDDETYSKYEPMSQTLSQLVRH